jgi:hypothetical protein
VTAIPDSGSAAVRPPGSRGTHGRPTPPFRVDFLAGGAAGLLGMIAFGVFHTLWIANVPAVFLEGLLHVSAFGAALAWAVRSVDARRAVRSDEVGGLALGAVLWVTLVPYEVAGLVWGPFPMVTSFHEALPVIWLSLFGAPVGALAGWLTARSLHAVLACSVAALALDFFLGGSMAFFGGRGPVLGLFLVLLPVCLAAGLVYMAVRRRLTGRDA